MQTRVLGAIGAMVAFSARASGSAGTSQTSAAAASVMRGTSSVIPDIRTSMSPRARLHAAFTSAQLSALSDRIESGDLSALVVEDRAINPNNDPVGTVIYELSKPCKGSGSLGATTCFDDEYVLPGSKPTFDMANVVKSYAVPK